MNSYMLFLQPAAIQLVFMNTNHASVKRGAENKRRVLVV